MNYSMHFGISLVYRYNCTNSAFIKRKECELAILKGENTHTVHRKWHRCDLGLWWRKLNWNMARMLTWIQCLAWILEWGRENIRLIIDSLHPRWPSPLHVGNSRFIVLLFGESLLVDQEESSDLKSSTKQSFCRSPELRLIRVSFEGKF